MNFFKNNWLGGLIAVIYFLLFFFIVPLAVQCTYHSTSDSEYCVGFVAKDTIPAFFPQSLLPIDLGFFAPVFWSMNFLTMHLTPIDPNDTALIILLLGALFYLAGNIIWKIVRKIFGK